MYQFLAISSSYCDRRCLKKCMHYFSFAYSNPIRVNNAFSFIPKQKCATKVLYAKNPPWRIMFFGSDAFAVKSLKLLCSKFRTKTLISGLDVTTSSSTGWSNERNLVYQFAESEKLKIHDWPIDTACITNKYDIGVVVSFGHLLPAEVLDSFPLGILNVHGSLLPRWRGAAPIRHAILNGDTVTGITIMKINPYKFDTGDIVRQYQLAIKPHETALELTDRLADVGAHLLMECIRDLPRSVYTGVPQSNQGISYAKKVIPSMAFVDWQNKSALEIYNQHRALSDLYPLRTYWFGSLLKLSDISLDQVIGMNTENRRSLQSFRIDGEIFPGLVEFSKKRRLLRVQCKDGKWICVNRVVICGKKYLSPSEFYNGYLSKIKNSLERRFNSIGIE